LILGKKNGNYIVFLVSLWNKKLRIINIMLNYVVRYGIATAPF